MPRAETYHKRFFKIVYISQLLMYGVLALNRQFQTQHTSGAVLVKNAISIQMLCRTLRHIWAIRMPCLVGISTRMKVVGEGFIITLSQGDQPAAGHIWYLARVPRYPLGTPFPRPGGDSRDFRGTCSLSSSYLHRETLSVSTQLDACRNMCKILK